MAGHRHGQVLMPEDLHQLLLAISMASLTEQLQEINPHMTSKWLKAALGGIPESQYIQLGRKWVKAWHTELKALAQIAHQAEQAPNPRSVLVGLTQPYWCEFLGRVWPQYFRLLLMQGTLLEGEPLLKFLRLLQELARS